jgi:RNA polymerase sigma-70 factor (ECF subfamily)
MNSKSEKDRFIAVIKAHKGIIYKVVNSYCKDADDRQDLAQDIMVQLWKSLNNYDDTYKMSTFIYKISLNVAISHYRKEGKRKTQNVAIEEALFLRADDDTPTNQSDFDQLNDFIYQLDPFNKALIMLYLEDKTYKEIADIMGISETNVGTKINRIKKQLKDWFNQISKQSINQ